MLDQPYVPINVAALSEAGHLRRDPARRSAAATTSCAAPASSPTAGPWVDTASTLSQGDAGDLATGPAAGRRLPGRDQRQRPGLGRGAATYTFAQPFTLDLGHGSTIPAVAADSTLSTRFTAEPGQPGARGRAAARRAVVRPLRERLPQRRHAASSWPRRRAGDPPPPSWTRCSAGSRGNPALKPVTLSQLFAAGARRAATTSRPCASCSRGSATPRHHTHRRRPHRDSTASSWPRSAGAVGGPPRQPDHARRHAVDHRGARPQRGRARRRVERLRQDLRRHDRTGHAGDRAHRDLHLATGRHPRHRAVLRALSGARSSSR